MACYTYVTVHSVHSNVAKIHSRLPAAMEFWLVWFPDQASKLLPTRSPPSSLLMNYYVDLCFNCSRRSRNYHRFAYLSISRNNYCFIAFYCAFPHLLMLHHNKKEQKFTNCCSSYIRTIIQGEREIIILSIISMCRYAQSCDFISVIELPRIPAYYPKPELFMEQFLT